MATSSTPEPTAPEPEEPRSWRPKYLGLWLGLAVAVALVVWFVNRERPSLEDSHRPSRVAKDSADSPVGANSTAEAGAASLNQARQSLTGIVAEASAVVRTEHAKQAIAALAAYERSGGEERDAALLLLCAAHSVLGELEPVEQLFPQVDAASVGATDLNTAAGIFAATGQHSRAEKLVEAALATNQDREQTLRVAAALFFEVGRDDEVLRYCQELTKLAPKDPNPWLVIAKVYENRGEANSLMQVYKTLLTLAPQAPSLGPKTVPQIRILLVDNALRMGAIAEARQHFDLIKSKAPEVAATHRVLEARLLQTEGKVDEAVTMVDAVLQQYPDDKTALLLKGRILVARGQAPEAIAVLTKLVQADPASHEGHYLLGQAYSRQGNKDEAKRQLEIHGKLITSKVTINALERRAAHDPQDLETRRQLAKLYEEIGLSELANYWNRAVQVAEEGQGGKP